MPMSRVLAAAAAALPFVTACGPQPPAAPEYETVAVERRAISVVVEAADALTFADHFAEGDFVLVVCELDLGWGSGASVLAS